MLKKREQKTSSLPFSPPNIKCQKDHVLQANRLIGKVCIVIWLWQDNHPITSSLRQLLQLVNWDGPRLHCIMLLLLPMITKLIFTPHSKTDSWCQTQMPPQHQQLNSERQAMSLEDSVRDNLPCQGSELHLVGSTLVPQPILHSRLEWLFQFTQPLILLQVLVPQPTKLASRLKGMDGLMSPKFAKSQTDLQVLKQHLVISQEQKCFQLVSLLLLYWPLLHDKNKGQISLFLINNLH